MSAVVANTRRAKCDSATVWARVARSIAGAKAGLQRFAGDGSGDVAVLFALMTIVMCLFMGAAIDVGRWLHARQQTRSAVDAAVLAGARALQLDGSNLSGAVAAAQNFYVENTKTRMTLLSDSITFKAADNSTAFTAEGNAYIETPILGLANVTKLPLLATAGTDYSKAVLAVGGNAELSLEISLMLDISGSMSGSKLDDMKAAAKDLVDIVVWQDQSSYTSKVAIAPFSTDIAVPSSMRNSVRGTGLPASKSLSYSCTTKGKKGTCSATYYLSPCVVERTGANKYSDAAPGSGNYVMARYTSNGTCSQPSTAEVMPLSSDKAALKTMIDNLPLAASTAGHLGTAWAWYLISPNWASVFPAASQPAAYGTTSLQKIAILMTDGEYNTQYDANGVKTGSTGAGSAANGSSVVQAKALCDGMKGQGITVYTVGFDLGGNQTAIDTLEYCATNPGTFYNADDGEELKQAFRDIALKLSSLYLSK